jgi:hypothetical protein
MDTGVQVHDRAGVLTAARSYRSHPGLLLPVLALLLVVTSCSSTGTTSAPARGSVSEVPAPGQYGGAYAGGHASGDTEAGAAFARWVLEQDPRHELMTDAVVRGESTLGVKVQPRITKADTQRLLVGLTEGMARAFPGTPLTVIAFYQSGDKLAEASYDGRSNQVDVQFAQ